MLTDRVSDRLAGQVSPSQYYGWKRYASASRTGISLSSQFDVCDNEINDLSLALLLDSSNIVLVIISIKSTLSSKY